MVTWTRFHLATHVCSSQLLQHPVLSQDHFSNPQLLNCKVASSLCLLQRELLESINSLLSSISVLSNNYIETKSKMPRHSPFKNFQLRYKCKSGSMQHQSSRSASSKSCTRDAAPVLSHPLSYHGSFIFAQRRVKLLCRSINLSTLEHTSLEHTVCILGCSSCSSHKTFQDRRKLPYVVDSLPIRSPPSNLARSLPVHCFVQVALNIGVSLFSPLHLWPRRSNAEFDIMNSRLGERYHILQLRSRQSRRRILWQISKGRCKRFTRQLQESRNELWSAKPGMLPGLFHLNPLIYHVEIRGTDLFIVYPDVRRV